MTATPKPRPWVSWFVALAVGTGGGYLFLVLRMPLPWMLGSIAAVTVLALAGARPAVPTPLRVGMVAILGVMLGSWFTPDMVDSASHWGVTLGALGATAVATTTANHFLLRRGFGYDAPTSYFSGAPGGISELVTVGSAMGGDERTISLVHSIRVTLTVFAIPIWFRLTGGEPHDIVGGPGGMGSLSAIGLADLAWLGASGVVGYWLAVLLRLPAAQVIGPLMVSAGVHLAGATAARPPMELVAMAQVVLGASIGCRFAGLSARGLSGRFAAGALSTGLTMVVTVAVALGLASAAGVPFPVLLLAFAPGGLAEMCLVAMSFGIDVAFISTHHVARIVLVVALAPLVFRLSGVRDSAAPATPPPPRPH